MQDFTILLTQNAFGSGVGSTLDVLSCAAALAPDHGYSPPTWRVVSDQPTVPLSNGLKIDAAPLPDGDEPDSSIWVIPGVGLSGASALEELHRGVRFQPAVDALRRHTGTGGIVAASCSAVFLLGEAGALAGRRATTTWWLGSVLQRLAPTCDVDVDKMVIHDGPIITAGAAFAHLDLMLHLVQTRFGPALAEAVSREMVIDGRQSQAEYIVPSTLAHGNDLVGRLISIFESALPHVLNVEGLASELGVSSRTLLRHVKAATGRSVSELLQGVRLNRARRLLETSGLSVEQIAAQVGYQDPTALRRLMRRVVKSTPRQFRKKI